MLFQQIYLPCLAQASYLIGSQGRAAVVDPRRDVDEYLQLAEQNGLRIERILLTHIHADFVAGHRELAARTGAAIAMSHRVDAGFPFEPLRDGDRLEVGSVTIEVLETPGHTPSDLCFLVRDSSAPEIPAKLLSGDTLFIGDVGRPDLAMGLGYSKEDMAGMMYDSLRDKILPLDDGIEVFPAHGAGSACGRNISNETSSTIGHQRLANPALQPQAREEFVASMTTDLAPAPAYFAYAATLNCRGPRLDAERPALRELDPTELAGDGQVDASVLDVRSAAQYGAGHLPDSINIGLTGSFASWCGSLLPLDRPVAIVATDLEAAEEARMRLGRVGIDDVAGWTPAAKLGARADAVVPQIEPTALDQRLRDGWQLIDVRGAGEFTAGHAPGATPAPLPSLARGGVDLTALDRNRPTAVICGSGYRSSAATVLLRRLGFRDLHNVTGGTNAWAAAGLPLER